MSQFWKGKRVCVTGGAGFLGSHLCERLLRLGAEVIALDDASRGQNRVEGVLLTIGDAGDYDTCLAIFDGCDAVFNLAAHVAGLLYNRSHHFEMFERNERLQLTPVRAARALDVPRFLQVSSVCVYAPEYAAGAVEADGAMGEPVAGNAGYSWAKRIGERVALWADLPHCVIVRPSNMYGPRDYFDERAHVIPNLIKKCLDRESTIFMQSPPETRREFIFVEDCASGIINAVEHGQANNIYNLGTHGETNITLRELLGEIRQICGVSKNIKWLGRRDAGDSNRWSNTNKARDELIWSYQTRLHEGLSRTIEWYINEGTRGNEG